MAGEKKELKPEPNWQLIFGLETKESKTYIDANSLRTSETKTGKFNTADILISFTIPKKMNNGKKDFMVHSMVKVLVIECNDGLAAPVYDLYFDTAVPTRKHKSLGGVEYPTNVELTAQVLPKTSYMYSALCPKYI